MWETGLLCYIRKGILAFKTSLFSPHALSPQFPPQLDCPKHWFASSYSVGRDGAFCLRVVMGVATTAAGFSSNTKHWSVPAQQVKQFIEL